MAEGAQHQKLTIRFGKEELVIRQRYEFFSIINDILIAIWFIIGSILYFNPNMGMVGTWCFLLGSVQLLVRPMIRLSRQMHLRKVRPAAPHESDLDF